MRRLLPIALLILAQATCAEDWLYLTYPGDTPLKIGRTYLRDANDWEKVLELNKVKNEYVLPVNTRIRIPVELLKVTPAPARVGHVEGNVRVRPEGGVFRPLAVGDQISGGETVLTGPRSFAAFVLADGSKLTQQASSRLVFGRLAAYGKTGMVATELALDGGRIEAAASRQVGPAGSFKVRTTVAVAGLRGTDFRLNVSEDGQTLRSEVLDGAVGVAAAGQEVLVAKAQGTLTEQGKPPEPPRPLLPAPAADGLPARVIDLPLAFAWPAMADARAWRAQVAADAGFQQVLLDSLADAPSASWDAAPPDGHYFLRVRAVDAAGLEGLNTDHPFELDARPLPPQQTAPADGERSYQETVAFGWAAAPEAQGYLLQVATSADFPAGQTVERRLDAVLNHSERLATGAQHWRIASLDEAGQPRGWSPVRSVRVQPLPMPPHADSRADGGKAVFAWAPVADAASYDIEISARDDFGAPAAHLHVAERQASAALKPGRYAWRMRALEADGQAGTWSQPATLVMPPVPPTGLRVVWTESVTTISWQGNAPAYRLEFARTPDFGTPFLVLPAEAGPSRLATFEPGQYWVRVTALDEAGAAGGASQPEPFKVLSLH